MKTLKKLSLLLTCLVANGLLFADCEELDLQQSTPTHDQCKCGCHCKTPCTCGCEQSGRCNCACSWKLDPDAPYFCDFCENDGTWNGPSECQNACNYGCCGIWLPEDPPLFRPFAADPREVDYSVGWRFNDQVLANNIGAVSFGDTIGIYEWCHVWPWGGKMRIDIEGCVWAVFAQCQKSAPLINADYYVAIPLTYAINNWSFRLRLFHISSHIGDEFLINNLPRGFKRKNPSAEYLDFSISDQLTEDIRVYGVIGVVIDEDNSFKIGRFYTECGLELRPQALRWYSRCDRLTAVPFYAMHFRTNSHFRKHVDATYCLGYEFAKDYGLCRRLRIYLEYHDGYSVEGQFAHFATDYLSIRVSYGF